VKVVETYCLGDLGFPIKFPFPAGERKKILGAVGEIALSSQREIQRDLDAELARKLEKNGYTSDHNKCKLWRPDFEHAIDIYNQSRLIGIEIEKSEKKRVVHDVLKLVNGASTFVPKIRYGVLVIPSKYFVRGKPKSFAATAKQDIRFYVGNIIANSANMHDLLVVVYDVVKT